MPVTALFRAIRGGEHGTVVQLVDAWRGPHLADLRDADGLSLACVAAQHGMAATLSFLGKRQANLSAADEGGRTPMHHAAMFGRRDAMRVLPPADLARKDRGGYTPVHMAAVYDDAVEHRVSLPSVGNDTLKLCLALGAPMPESVADWPPGIGLAQSMRLQERVQAVVAQAAAEAASAATSPAPVATGRVAAPAPIPLHFRHVLAASVTSPRAPAPPKPDGKPPLAPGKKLPTGPATG